MIGRSFRREKAAEAARSKGFDDFELRLGDTMRGERATLGKSLLDVQRELRIKASYIAAIENADPSAFDTPGFIAGYVRSYARYLGMDADKAFATFCRESGFATAHGMSAAASQTRPTREERLSRSGGKDMFSAPATPFVPAGDALLSRVEPGAIGSVLVLLAMIGGLGYGGYRILQEVQKVTFAPVENAPVAYSEVDRLGGATVVSPSGEDTIVGVVAPTTEALDRLYRPQALDVPVLAARDGPISSLDPSTIGTLIPELDPVELAVAEAAALDPAAVQVTEAPVPNVQVVAVRPAWVRIRAADDSVIFEGILNAGDIFEVPLTEDPANLRVGESGSVYFAVNGVHYGPVGPRGVVTSNIDLSPESVAETFAVADLTSDQDLARMVNVADASQ